ncbi:MAG: GntR family transcriptional regulator [Gemmatimonadales bacterium]
MLVVIDPHNGVPVYRQIIDQVRFQVASGTLRPGDELPSTRTLSAELGVNPMTVSKAYSLLDDDQVITRRPGLPLVVSDQSPRAEEKAKAASLEQVLAPAVLAARQLGLADKEALEIYRRALADARPRKEPNR